MRNRLSLVALLSGLVLMVGNLGVAAFGLVMATGPARKVFLVVAIFQTLVLLGVAAVAGWKITRRYADAGRPDCPETDYHDPPRAD